MNDEIKNTDPTAKENLTNGVIVWLEDHKAIKVELPNPSTVCRRCPKAMWTLTKEIVETKGRAEVDILTCFCRVTHTHSWTNDRPVTIQVCSGALED